MSKATEALTAQLVPTSKTPRIQQYKIAWDLLLKIPGADEWHRAQAKCWLTYRAFDGQITLDDWKKLIAPERPKTTTWMKARWDVSQASAEAYLWLRRGNDSEKLNMGIEAAERACAMEPRIQEYPPTILNWLRMVTLLAVRKWVIGCEAESKQLIERAIDCWRGVATTFHWRTHPTRFTEMLGDCYALSMLMFLAQRLGLTKQMPNREWISPAFIAQKHRLEPWIICLKELQTPGRKLW